MEASRGRFRLVQPARLELPLLDPQVASPKEEWPLGTATQTNTWEDWVPKVSRRSALVSFRVASVAVADAHGVPNLDENDEWVVGVRQERR